MTTLIIRDLDDRVGAWLKQEAARRNTSVNKLSGLLLTEAMEPHAPKHNLLRFAGTWTEEDARVVMESVAESDAYSLANDWK